MQDNNNDPMNTKLENTQEPGDTRQLLEPVHQSPTAKISNYLTAIALVLIGLTVGVFLFWSFTSQDALDIKNDPLDVKPIVLKSEENLTISANFCKLVDAPGTMYVRFVSKQTELVVPTQRERLEKRCYEKLEFQVPIPPQTPPGVYHLNYRVEYKTNPITTVREEFNTREFTVTE